MERVLKAGAFAQLCRTTKETLRHYDRLGLLEPFAYSAAGYKLYSITQYADFAFISALQGAGLSLAEIKGFLHNPEIRSLDAVLQEQVEKIEHQQAELERKKEVLQTTLYQTEYLRSWFNDADVHISQTGYRWRIRECCEEYFIETATPYTEDREQDFIEAISDHVAFCEDQGWGSAFQEAYRVDAAVLDSGEYSKGFCAEASIPQPIESLRLRIKPAGTYLCWLNRIEWDLLVVRDQIAAEDHSETIPDENPMFVAYDALRKFAADQGWKLYGDLYDVVLSLYGGQLSDALYTEVSMLVSRESS